jgi:hypothetical protein
MTDRELLELAAKAAGIDLDGWSEYGYGFDTVQNPMSWWNPLTDDGDALRLAVKLEMSFVSGGHGFKGKTIWVRCGMTECTEYQNEDPYAATRRAVVRCAAEIGKGMP